MINIQLSSIDVQFFIDEVFNSDRDPITASSEDGYDRIATLWFEINGMLRVVRSNEWQWALEGDDKAAEKKEYFVIREMLLNARKRAEKLFDEAIDLKFGPG